jgi:hypothetical protein
MDSPKSLTIALPIKLRDFWIRLMNWREQVVASDDELLADGRAYLINLPEPLKTGRAYRLTLDAELGSIITDDSGRTWNEFAPVGDMTNIIGGITMEFGDA